MTDHAQGFEQSLLDLEERVRHLESGDVPLDKALRLYEEGVALARTCHQALQAAESRVVALSHGANGVNETPIPEPER